MLCVCLASNFKVKINIKSLTNEIIWIGGYRKEDEKNVWGWTDGSPWKYSNWGAGEPNNDKGIEDHIDMNWGGAGLWNDEKEDVEIPFVCQRCQSGWQYYLQNKKCYKYFSTKSSPTYANDFCKSFEVNVSYTYLFNFLTSSYIFRDLLLLYLMLKPTLSLILLQMEKQFGLVVIG